jgi:hypothetical protein
MKSPPKNVAVAALFWQMPSRCTDQIHVKLEKWSFISTFREFGAPPALYREFGGQKYQADIVVLQLIKVKPYM